MAFALGGSVQTESPDRCLGVDPGLNRTGYAILVRRGNKAVLREGGVIRSTTSGSLAERVYEIHRGLCEVLDEFSPSAMAIEQVFTMSRNPKTALLMAHARGVVLCAAAERNIDVVHYAPRQVKRLLTGSGAAGKQQVQQAVTRELGLDAVPEPNDVADACAVALCHFYAARMANV